MRFESSLFTPSRALGASDWLVLLGIAVGATGSVDGQLVLQVDRTDDSGLVTACDDLTPNDCTLRGAISLANLQAEVVDVTIELAAATYELTLNGPGEDLNNFGDLDILRDMTIRGQGPGETVISAGEFPAFDDRLIEVHAPHHAVVLENLSFANAQPVNGLHAVFVGSTNTIYLNDCSFSSNGSIVNGGGALRISYGASAFISSCDFSLNSTTTDGAAISSAANLLWVLGSEFHENTSLGRGGALALELPTLGEIGTTILAESRFEDNRAQYGGALWASEATDTLVETTVFRANEATIVGPGEGSGGAILSSGHLEIQYSTLEGNSSETGGSAITSEYVDSPQPVVDIFNSTLSGNFGSDGDLASIHLENVQAELLHVTMNEQILDISSDQADLIMQNNLSAGGCDLSLGTFESFGGNLASDDSCWGLLPSVGDQVVADFGLLPLGMYGGRTPTHLPAFESSALGAAPMCPELDQRSMARPLAECASGSVERQANEGLVFADGFETGDLLGWSNVVD